MFLRISTWSRGSMQRKWHSFPRASQENERIGFSSNPEQILLFFYRFSLRFRRDASQSRFQSRELTDRVNPNKFQEFSFRQLPSPPPLSRNLEPRTKISFSPRSKNRENRKWGNTRTKNNWKKWVEFIRKRSFRKFYLRFIFRVPRLSITDNFLDSPPFRHTTQWLEVVSLLPRDTIKNLLTRFNKKV